MTTTLLIARSRITWLRALLVGAAGSVGTADANAGDLPAHSQPAARLLAPIPLAETRPSLVRAAAPDPVGVPYSVPVSAQPRLLGITRTTARTESGTAVSAPSFMPIGVGYAGSQSLPGRSSNPTSQPPLAGLPASSTTPTPTSGSPREFVPYGVGFAGPQAGISGGVPAWIQPPAAAPAAPPGVYAGPPAYRWYGWGSVTPGGNPYAPNGQYPKASANWYAQTGATPGAFPIPVTVGAGARMNGSDQPAYQLTPAMELAPPARVQVEPMPAGVPAQLPIPVPPQTQALPRPNEALDPRAIAQTPVVPVAPQPIFQPPPAPAAPVVPSIPSGVPVVVGPVPVAQTPAAKPAVHHEPDLQRAAALLPVPRTQDMPLNQPIAATPGAGGSKPAEPTWQTASGSTSGSANGSANGSATTPPPESPRPAMPSVEPPTNWSVPSDGLPRVRAQAESETASAEQAIRTVAEARVSSLSFASRGTGKLTVIFTARDEATARALAEDIARLPEVKSYEVSFEASVMEK